MEIEKEIAGNIGSPDEVDLVLENGGDGIGLYRTEFLYMDRNELPTEQEQFEAYGSVLEKMNGKPVVIRTLDIGGDKNVDYLDFPDEMNPFLGYRAIRYCLENESLFKEQLRALVRASAYGNLKIMFPMISGMDELIRAKELLAEAKREAMEKDAELQPTYEVGLMIETPAAAMMADQLAKQVDFFSIGTNDLIQYTVAVDRMNEHIAQLYDPFHPAVLRLIKRTIEQGAKAGIWVGMCGELAGDPKLIPVFVGMGLDEFSMSAGSILEARSLISKSSMEELAPKVDELLALGSGKEVKQYIEENLMK